MSPPDKLYNKDTPLYNIRIIRSYIDFIERHYPHIDVDKILNYAGISRLQYNDYGFWYSQRVVNRFQEIIGRDKQKEITCARRSFPLLSFLFLNMSWFFNFSEKMDLVLLPDIRYKPV